jgi:hypothetical protein
LEAERAALRVLAVEVVAPEAAAEVSESEVEGLEGRVATEAPVEAVAVVAEGEAMAEAEEEDLAEGMEVVVAHLAPGKRAARLAVAVWQAEPVVAAPVECEAESPVVAPPVEQVGWVAKEAWEVLVVVRATPTVVVELEEDTLVAEAMDLGAAEEDLEEGESAENMAAAEAAFLVVAQTVEATMGAEANRAVMLAAEEERAEN